MKSEWEYMAIDDLFELHEQMQEVLRGKLKAKKVELDRRLRQLNQRSKLMEKPSLRGLVMALGHCGFALQLLPLVSNL